MDRELLRAGIQVIFTSPNLGWNLMHRDIKARVAGWLAGSGD